MWLWLVNDIVAVMNRNNILCGSFGIYPSFVAGILNSVEKIQFCALRNKQLNYRDYIGKRISSKECSISYKGHTGNYLRLSPSSETVAMPFESRIIRGKLLSQLIFAQDVLKSTIVVSGLRHSVF